MPSCSRRPDVSQVRGQKAEKTGQKGRAKTDKQEVEIRQRMTVAALATAMNKDFGKVAGGGGVLHDHAALTDDVPLLCFRPRV